MSATATRSVLSPAPPSPGPRPRHWTREEYYRAAELGLFRPDERLELLDGQIITKMTRKPLHSALVSHAARLVTNAFGPGYYSREQQPLVLHDSSEPEPDVVVVPGTELDYLARHPSAAEACLVIEVSDTTLRFDRGRKRNAYARAGVMEYWILNLVHCQLEVYREPSRARYRTIRVYRQDEEISPLAAPHASIRVLDLLPATTPHEPERPDPSPTRAASRSMSPTPTSRASTRRSTDRYHRL